MNENYHTLKEDVMVRLGVLIEDSKSFTTTKAIEAWKQFSAHPFFSIQHSADPTKLFYYLEGEDPDEHCPCEIDLYDADHIQKARDERGFEGLGTDKYFIIGGVYGADDMCFLCSDFSKGLAILYHDYVFCSKDLDAQLDEAATELSLTKFFECLNRREN